MLIRPFWAFAPVPCPPPVWPAPQARARALGVQEWFPQERPARVLGELLFAVLAFEGGSSLILMPCPSAPPLFQS